MRKLKAGIIKEFLLLLNDKVGLAMMVLLPIVLVIIMTSIQNSALNLMNSNQIELIVSNNDKDDLSQEYVTSLKQSKLFKIVEKDITKEQLHKEINNSNIPFGLYLSDDFSSLVDKECDVKIKNILGSMGLGDVSEPVPFSSEKKTILLIYNPIIQSNHAQSVKRMVSTLSKKLSTNLFLAKLSEELEIDPNSLNLEESLEQSNLSMQKASMDSSQSTHPNASQHNVPAWSIFAVFFMVVSLAGNFVKEKVNGSFDRVLTMPSSVWYLLGSKALLFWVVSLFQVLLIFTISRFVFQFIGLPTLFFPDNIFVFLWIILLTGATAVSYSLLIGVFSKTVEQAAGFGAISVIIFSAIGGIWVPSFVMPPLLKSLSNASPLHWCIELFYAVFLKDGSFSNLLIPSLILLGMNLVFILFIYLKLRTLNGLLK